MPLLFIAGGADLYAPPGLMRLLKARVKHSEFVVVPEAGHSAYWEQPDTVQRRSADVHQEALTLVESRRRCARAGRPDLPPARQDDHVALSRTSICARYAADATQNRVGDNDL